MREMYDWVAWHRELARKIAEGDEDDLVEKIGLVADYQMLDAAKLGKDPLSFFGFLRDSQSESNDVCETVKDVFGLRSKLPDPELRDFIFPYASESLSREGAMFSSIEVEGFLWRLFKRATKDNPRIKQEDWKVAMDRDGVEVATLTQALFLVNPDFFLPVDSAVDAYFPEGWRKEKEEKIRGDGGYKEYLSAREEIKKLFPGCEPYEIYTFLSWQKDKGAISKDSKFFQVSTNALGKGSGDFWDKDSSSYNYVKENNFKENNWVFVGGPGAGMGWKEVEEENLSRDDIKKFIKTSPYPLYDNSKEGDNDFPKRGDIVLVRTGQKKGRAIGIVLENDYNRPDGLREKSKIHVLWINKSESSLSGLTYRSGFNSVNQEQVTYRLFANAEAYKSSFELINQLTGNTIGSGKQVNQDRQQARANTMKHPHPLNTILYGPPGTGKTYDTVNYAVAIIEGRCVDEVKKERRKEDKGEGHKRAKELFDKYLKEKRIEMVTFHQNYAYEDFIEGIRPVLKNNQSNEGQGQEIEYELSQGIFKEISKRAEEEEIKNYVLIIDEINRGNIAKIFGELITLIEESRRLGRSEATEVTLPYSGEPFGVPDNLYIIGTMNTADRSIALLDTALRRRFEFKEMMPDPELLPDTSTNIDGVNCRDLLKAMNERIRVLLDREHQIGHTYFFGVEDIESLKKAFQNKIIPLLQEYFYDNWEKIYLVLNQNKEGFIDTKSIDEFIDSDRFKKSDLIDKQGKIYEILPEDDPKWNKPESYQDIYESNDARNQEQSESGNAG